MIWQRRMLNKTVTEVCRDLNVSRSFVQNMSRRFNATGDFSRSRRRRGPGTLLNKYEEFLLFEIFLDHPTTYLHEAADHLENQTGRSISISAVMRTMRRYGLSRQKVKQVAIQRSTVERIRFMTEIQVFDPRMLVFSDETGCDKRNALRKFGYNIRGIQPRNVQFLVRGQRMNSIGIMNYEGVLDAYVTERNVGHEVFSEFVQRSLVRIFRPCWLR